MPVSAEEVALRIRSDSRSRAAAAEHRAAVLRAKLGRAGQLLRDAGAKRVWLFGSLATATPGLESDVDLAAEALPRARYFELLAALTVLFETRVDLALLEDSPESLRERVLATGLEL